MAGVCAPPSFSALSMIFADVRPLLMLPSHVKGQGTVLFVGFHINTGGARVGVALDQSVGNNNGVIKGQFSPGLPQPGLPQPVWSITVWSFTFYLVYNVRPEEEETKCF